MIKKTNIEQSFKKFSINELKKVTVPPFQRWIIEQNKKDIHNSVEKYGLLRCPVICFIKETGENVIIDGNHLRLSLIDAYIDDVDITCIYKEVNNTLEGRDIFRILNSIGRRLEHPDITNLHMHTSASSGSIYRDIWTIIGNPTDIKSIKTVETFSLATIISVLAQDKESYRLGEGLKKTNYVNRKFLLNYLIEEVDTGSWGKKFNDKKIKPNGGAMISFINVWFGQKYFERCGDHPDEMFLDIIVEIYTTYRSHLKSGILKIGKDNAGKILQTYVQENYPHLVKK